MIILWRQRRTVLRVPKGVGGLSRYLTARFILIAAAGAQLVLTDEFDALEKVACVVTVVALATEPIRAFRQRGCRPVRRELPRPREPRNRAAFPYGWMFPLNLLALLALVLSGASCRPAARCSRGDSRSISIVLALLAFLDIRAAGSRARRRLPGAH